MGTGYLDPGPGLSDLREWAKLEGRFHDVLRRFDKDAEFMPVRDALEVERLCEGIRRNLRMEKERLVLAAEGGDGS